MATQKKKKSSLSAFSILILVMGVICLISLLLNGQAIDPAIGGEVAAVTGAKLSDFIMAIPNGFKDASDLIIFILAIGGFIGIVMKTGALEAGVYHLVKKLKGKEEVLIVVLMILFSAGGTTYGMAEETIGFYALITTAMVAAGFDSIVAVGTVLLGAGTGVLGSTINPFATGAAMAALSSSGVEPNPTLIMILGAILWVTSTFIAILFVLSYAKKVKRDKGSTILSLQEQEVMHEHFSKNENRDLEFTSKHRLVLTIFALTFVLMIVSLIYYQDIIFGGNEDAYLAAFGWSAGLTGTPLGWWYFMDLAALFIIASILVALVARMSEKEFIDNFMAGAADLLSVALIIATARGITIVMNATHMDLYILDVSSKLLQGVPGFIFAPMSYIVYLVLSFLVPSTSGLAGLSMPVMGGLANTLGFNASVMIMIFSAGSGLINLFTPTSGVVMGGIGAAKIEYSTYLKWVMKLLFVIAIANIIILSIAMMVA
ncbi:YfcC family protein [Erysipelotrichaceae bacterium OH741_COT-311]|nr:YfcC family protein [Erysipelotrichaceae bacterium OH741_COT-311]